LERLGDMLKRELGRFGPQAGIAEVVAAWPAAVGAEIARNAWPARFTRDGTLVVHTRDSVWSFELTQRAEEIAGRLSNAKSVRFVPGPLPEATVEYAEATPQGSPTPTPEQVRQAVEWTAQIDNEGLREAVKRTAELSLARAANDRPF
jgi:Dna[CI] antecedent DciA-like protein